jgi:ABC-type lipoprotein release transport system permease subunit
MSNTISAHHPAVVLRSSYRLVRTLLAIATVAIVGLTVAVVILAINNGSNTTASTAARANPSTLAAQPTVQPNPDEQGAAISPTPLGSNSSYYYPGHF